MDQFPHTQAGQAAVGQAAQPPAATAPIGADHEDPEQKGKVTAAEVRAALRPAIDAGPASAAAIAKELASVDFIATPEDAAADAIMAAVETVTEGDDKATGGASAGHGARLNHGQAILVAQALRAARSA